MTLLVLLVSLSSGCQRSAQPSSQPSPAGSSADRRITIEAFQLSFQLSPSFQVVEEPDIVFLARSAFPRGLLTIEPDEPSVIGHEAEGGETLTSVTIDGVDAVVVHNAVLEDLPEGLEARQLLVANGQRSFSLIMSAVEPELPRLWRRLIATVEIRPE